MEIKVGMRVKCIACDKPIEVKEDSIIKCWDGKYLTCPNCRRSLSLESYVRNGELIE